MVPAQSGRLTRVLFPPESVSDRVKIKSLAHHQSSSNSFGHLSARVSGNYFCQVNRNENI